MKKLLSLLMVLLIAILPHLPIANATMVSSTLELDPILEDSPVYGVFQYKGELYSIAQEFLLKKKADSNEFETIAKLRYKEESTLEDGTVKVPYGTVKIDGDNLYLVNNSGVYSIQLDGTDAVLEQVMKLENSSETGYIDTYNSIILDGTLYYIINSMGEPGSKLAIQKFSETEPRTIDLPYEQYGNPLSVGLYKEGSVHVLTDRKILTLENGSLKEYYSLPENEYFLGANVYYLSGPDAFYNSANNYVYQIKDGARNPISVLDYIATEIFAADDRTLGFLSPNGIVTLDVTTAKMPEKVLRVAGLQDQTLITSYNKKHPEMPAVNVDSYMSDPQTFSTEMKGEKKADVYFLEIHSYLDSLLKHEYVEPLDSDANLVATAARMYPYAQNMLKYQDKLYLMPYNVYNYGYEIQLNNLAYNIKAWEELGLTEADVPKTIEQFVKLLDKLYIEKYETMLADQMGLQENPYAVDSSLKMRAINLVSSNARVRGELPKFDTPEMLSLMEAVNNSEYVKETKEETFMEDLANVTSYLFVETEDIIDIPDNYRVMPLALTENDASHVYATATVAFVNSLSDNKAEAMAFLENMMENLSDRTKTYLFTDVNEPVKNRNLVNYLEKIEKTIAKLEQEIEEDKKTGGKNVKKLEQDIENWKQQIKFSENRIYTLTQEEIDTLNANADNIIIIRNLVFNWQNEQMSQLMSRFYDNDIPSKEFLTELDRMVNMMEQEGN